MWKRALAELDLSSIDELVLTNSSVFGPIFPLADSFSKMDEKRCAFWAMTDNVDITWHLQSYFLVFRRPVLASGDLERFFNTVLSYRDKDQIIRSYEVGLTTFLVEQGHEPAALVALADLGGKGRTARHLVRKNPTIYHPARLIDLGMPFVKVELLRDNPANVGLSPVRERMRKAGYDMGLVEFDRPAKAR
jgi:rhamnosyltransferase